MSWRLLLFSAILLSLSLSVSSLQCYSTICTDPDEHGFCTRTCTRPNDVCFASFFISPNHTVTPGTFQCHDVREDECRETSCQINDMAISFADCCCRQDHCNIIPGLFGENTPAPLIIHPTPPVTPPLIVGDELVCEFNNCTGTSNTDCFHGYERCIDHTSAGASSPGNHFCAVHARRTSSGHYELQSKGCEITTDQSVRQRGTGQSTCTLDTRSSDSQISCYCDQLFCNNGSNLHLTDPSRYVGPTGDILCEGGCSHACVVSGGVPRCLCPVGYVLDTDLMTCVDFNECLQPHSHQCSHICINTEGSYRCDCPPDPGLRLSANGTHCEEIPGLVCARHNRSCSAINGNCNGISYCDRDLAHLNIPRNKESCIAVVTFEAGEFDIVLQSCFRNDGECDSDKCVLTVHPDVTIQTTYSCCCRERLCNAQIVYPDLNSTSPPTELVTTSEMMPTTGVKLTVNTDDVKETTLGTVEVPQAASLSLRAVAIMATVIGVVIILSAILIFVCLIFCRKKLCFSKSVENDDSEPIDISSMIPVTNALLPRAMQFENPPIGSGRFSTVYKHTIGNDVRAVKVFQRKDKASYDRELAIYSQPNFKHQNVLLFITSNEYPEELQLIFEYHPVGSLYDVLNKQTISLGQFAEIAASSARGLSHLHTEVVRDGATVKPCVAHRDLKSKNILLKADMRTACISDFGLAIKWPVEMPTEAQGQVGTARYMAPEVLEGAISFDREAFFRIDIYAFALILWELTTRTKTANGPVADYRPPFDDMVPPNPSIDDMKKVVVDRQMRPVIPIAFTNHSEMDDITYTIQEIWDGDVDARLSSQCVCERLEVFARTFDSPKDSGYSMSEFETAEASEYSTQSSSLLSGSPTNTMKPPISETSTTMTGRGVPVPIGYPPNVAMAHRLPCTNVDSEQPDTTPLVTITNNAPCQAVNGSVGGVIPRPGGNPMVTYPQLPAVNVAPPLHSPGEYQYRFIQAPAFPRHPPPPPNNNNRHGNQSQSPTVTVRINQAPSSTPSSVSARRNTHSGTAVATERFSNLNNRNSREIVQRPPATPTVQYHLESTV